MARGVSLFWLPLRLLWEAVKAVALPAVFVAVSWWLMPDGLARVVTGLAVLYLAGLAVCAYAKLRGRVRSMARGTFTIRDEARRTRSRRRGR